MIKHPAIIEGVRHSLNVDVLPYEHESKISSTGRMYVLEPGPTFESFDVPAGRLSQLSPESHVPVCLVTSPTMEL